MYQRIVVTYLYPLNIAINISIFRQPHISYHWLVVSTPMKNIGQLGLLFPIYGKKKMIQTTNQYQVGYTATISYQHPHSQIILQ